MGTVAGDTEGTAAFAVLVIGEIPADVRRITNITRICDDCSHGADGVPADNHASASTLLAGGQIHDVPTLGALGLLLLDGGLGVPGVRRLRLAR